MLSFESLVFDWVIITSSYRSASCPKSPSCQEMKENNYERGRIKEKQDV